MNYIPMGSFVMGPVVRDVPYAAVAKSKTVSVQAFYIDRDRDHQQRVPAVRVLRA
ncbi:MAG: hypothetical protein IPI72_09015 [Flavobacteriales bacterium]|nr:hypothetical protein [Flavobacteriales bacterium]